MKMPLKNSSKNTVARKASDTNRCAFEMRNCKNMLR
jgi:hypothetical protein